MKCKWWVVEQTTKRGKTKIAQVGGPLLTSGDPPLAKFPGARRCGGTIVATVEAISEPYFGGSSPGLNITYRCDQCGLVWQEGLPLDEKGLSQALTEYVRSLP